ncbi:uncharacterized protein [Medicago truncatula]|uniref:uncharacterized protein n=1 Tax=Medicago truncatula TaxID=3880 RepID=UPI000D2F16F9|nr:uncharacterized protein LOC112421932 [Medicago truncatula]
MCLNNEQLSLTRLCCNIYILAETISSNSLNTSVVPPSDRFTRWNNNNHRYTILNVDGSCNGDPLRTGFGGVFRDHTGGFMSAFSGFIGHSQDILYAELSALHEGLVLAVNRNYDELACYSDSLLTVNLIKEDLNHYHVYAVLIQNIKDILSSRSFTLQHSLIEGNKCADFLAKIGASKNEELEIHSSPPEGLLPLLQEDAVGTLFLRR